ncbi:GNAT family N-acetyltransferase [Nocardia sp. NPDC046763]|uniref:GNAT family N-acetyltransferase n=1 Tax=Nocardia sp. NPDC046763 TaxID=3155256 RepID=UPI0033D6235D
MIVCGQLAEVGLDAARRLAVEYLFGAEGVDRCWSWRPDLVLSALLGERVVGVCFASPGSGTGIVVDGIAVDGSFAGRGIGSKLLSAWEVAARATGFTEVTVGSAGGYVEHFYEKNGYRPVEYCVTVPCAVDVNGPGGVDVTRVRVCGDFSLVNIASTSGRDPDAKAAALAACGGTHLSVIYAKSLTGPTN